MKCCNRRLALGKKTSLGIMFMMTSSLFVAEIVVGYITNSTALVADSFHMLSDVISLIIGFLAVLYSRKDSEYNTYGWARAEVLGALANAVFLLALCFTIIVSAIQRLVEIEKIENPLLLLYVGSAGLVINLIGLIIFHDHSHGNHENHNHNEALVEQKDSTIEKKQDTTHSQSQAAQLNMKGVFLHVLGDALGSVVVLVSALTIYFAKGQWRYYVDPLMSLVLATIMICTTWPLLKRSSLILLQNPPPHIDKNDIVCEMMKIHGIQAIHELHVWQLSGSIIIASVHVTMHKGDNFNEAAMEVTKIFHDKGIHSLTLQPEFYECMEGQSLCGSSTCHFLNGDRQKAVADGASLSDEEASTALESKYNINHSSSCLLPCVSNQCEEFRCCSNSRLNEKTKKQKKEYGESNPCYVDVDVDFEISNSNHSASASNSTSNNLPTQKESLPQCKTQERQSIV